MVNSAFLQPPKMVSPENKPVGRRCSIKTKPLSQKLSQTRFRVKIRKAGQRKRPQLLRPRRMVFGITAARKVRTKIEELEYDC